MLSKKHTLFNLILCIVLLIISSTNALSIKTIAFNKVIIQSVKDTSVFFKNKQLFGIDSGIIFYNIQLKKGTASSFSCIGFAQQQDSFQLNIRCNPSVQGYNDDTLFIESNIGNIPIVLMCKAFCKSALNSILQLDKDTLKCNTHDTVLIPLTLPQLNVSKIVSFSGTMTYNPTILKPLFGDIFAQNVPNEQPSYQVKFTMPIQNNDSIVLFHFLSSWGNEDISSIKLSDLKIDSCMYESNTESIPLQINVCKANGTRLFFTGNSTSLEIAYDNISPVLKISPGETGAYTYTVYSLQGKLVFSNTVHMNKLENISIPILNMMHNSLYCIVLQCPNYETKMCPFIW
jgi:hypothetical protein